MHSKPGKENGQKLKKMKSDEEKMNLAVKLARQSIATQNGGPFGAAIFKNGVLIGKGINRVTSLNDPTAHAEVNAIREACQNLKTFDLSGAEIYTTCEPCPMCLGAIYWAKIDKIYYAADRKDAANAGFIDDFIYQEISLPPDKRKLRSLQIENGEAWKIFDDWTKSENKIPY